MNSIPHRSSPTKPKSEDTCLQFNNEIQIHHLMTVPSENSTSFTALLELPATQAMDLLHSPYSGQFPPPDDNLTWKIEAAPGFSFFGGDTKSAETTSEPSNSSAKMKSQAAKNPKPNEKLRSVNRRSRAKKDKGASKKRKKENAEKLPYVHVRARRGQATDRHSLAERARREKINGRMKLLQQLVPGCNKISGTALVLDEIINHVQSLQRQVEFLSMRLSAVNPRVDFDIDSLMAAESGCLIDRNVGDMVIPLWTEHQLNGNRQQCHFDGFNQSVWGKTNNFTTPDNSLRSYDSSVLHSNQLKMEL